MTDADTRNVSLLYNDAEQGTTACSKRADQVQQHSPRKEVPIAAAMQFRQCIMHKHLEKPNDNNNNSNSNNINQQPPVHVFSRQPKQTNEDATAKLGVKFGLVINDMDKTFDQVELHMEVGEVCWYAAFQPLQAVAIAKVTCIASITRGTGQTPTQCHEAQAYYAADHRGREQSPMLLHVY